jgi:hypothetical protein
LLLLPDEPTKGAQHLQDARNALDRSEHPDCQYAWGRADGLHFCGLAHLRLGETELARQRMTAGRELRETAWTRAGGGNAAGVGIAEVVGCGLAEGLERRLLNSRGSVTPAVTQTGENACPTKTKTWVSLRFVGPTSKKLH